MFHLIKKFSHINRSNIMMYLVDNVMMYLVDGTNRFKKNLPGARMGVSGPEFWPNLQ